MASCYRCNADLPKGVPVIRRSVKMGESSGFSWGRTARVSSRSTYADKPFCATCVAAMGRTSTGSKVLAAGAVGLFAMVVVGSLSDNDPPRPQPAAIPAPVVHDMTTPLPTVAPKKHHKRNRAATVTASPQDMASELLDPFAGQ